MRPLQTCQTFFFAVLALFDESCLGAVGVGAFKPTRYATQSDYGDERYTDVKIARDGSAFVVGITDGPFAGRTQPANSNQAFAQRITWDSMGNPTLQWMSGLPGYAQNYSDLEELGEDSLVVSRASNIDFQIFGISKSTGAILWTNSFNNYRNHRLESDGSGRFLVYYGSYMSGVSSYGFQYRGSDGSLIWSKASVGYYITAANLSSDGQYIALGGYDDYNNIVTQLYSTNDGALLWTKTVYISGSDDVDSIDISPNGFVLVAIAGSPNFVLLNLNVGDGALNSSKAVPKVGNTAEYSMKVIGGNAFVVEHSFLGHRLHHFTADDFSGFNSQTLGVPIFGVATADISSSGALCCVGYSMVSNNSSTSQDAVIAVARIAVPKATASVTLGELGQIYDGSFKTVTVSTSPPGLATSVTYGGSPTPPVNAGSYRVVATIIDDNYQGSSAGTLVVAKSPQWIDFYPPSAPSFFNPGATFQLSAVSSAGLNVRFVSANPSMVAVANQVATVNGAGTVTLIATNAGTANYNPAGATRTVTVAKADQTIAFGALSNQVFARGKTFTLSASSSARLSVAFTSLNTDVVTIAGNVATLRSGGTAMIRATQAGNANFYAADPVERELVVTATSQTINFTQPVTPQIFAANKTFRLSATATSGLTVSFESSNTNVVTVAGNAATIRGSGTVEITARQGGNASFTPAPEIKRTVVVSKANQTIGAFAPVGTRVFGAAPFPAIAPRASSGLPVTLRVVSGPASVSGNMVTLTGAGTVVLAANQAGNENFNAAHEVTTSFVVNKRNVGAAVVLSDTSHTFSGTPKGVTVATVPPGLATRVTYNGSTNLPVNAGTYNVVVTINDANYQGSRNAKMTIGKATQNISFVQPGDQVFAVNRTFMLSASNSVPLPVTFVSANPAVVSVSGTTATIRAAGTARLTATNTGNANFHPAGASWTVPVAKANQTITFDALANQVFAPNRKFTLSATSSAGLPVTFTSLNTSVVTIAGNVATLRAGGTAVIRATQAGNANASAAPAVEQTLTVTR